MDRRTFLKSTAAAAALLAVPFAAPPLVVESKRLWARVGWRFAGEHSNVAVVDEAAAAVTRGGDPFIVDRFIEHHLDPGDSIEFTLRFVDSGGVYVGRFKHPASSEWIEMVREEPDGPAGPKIIGWGA